MATVTSLTAERMLAIEAASVIDGDVIGDNLILTKKDGSQINAGDVRGPQGIPGPVSSDLAAITAQPVLDIGLVGQIRAGRQLAATDFTNMGLAVPTGLWNLSDLSDASGNGRALSNKGAVPFTPGINGVANTAAKFAGLTTQALYISDTGAADPFRLKTGSWGCWFKSSRRSTEQIFFSKAATATNQRSWYFEINTANVASFVASTDGATFVVCSGLTDVCDGRWHFGVVTYDGGLLRLYVDGVLESLIQITSGLLFSSTAPINIGGIGGDAATATGGPFYGSVDEAFVTSDVMSPEQIRNLYCAKIPHTLGITPTRVTLNVRRRRRSSALVLGDFGTAPLRLHNFSAGSLGDEGSNNVPLAWNGAAQKTVGAVDGTPNNAYHFDGTGNLGATDAGLPGGANTRTYGCWVKGLTSATTTVLVAWGSLPSNRVAASGTDGFQTGPIVLDGQWHHCVVVEDNTITDGTKRKIYCDGRLIGISAGMGTITLAGANHFRIGADVDGSLPFTGQLDGVFVTDYAMSIEEIIKLYLKGTQTLAPSPKNVGDHVEALSATDLLVTFDSFDGPAQIDLGVAA
jgi:hypothetical protein